MDISKSKFLTFIISLLPKYCDFPIFHRWSFEQLKRWNHHLWFIFHSHISRVLLFYMIISKPRAKLAFEYYLFEKNFDLIQFLEDLNNDTWYLRDIKSRQISFILSFYKIHGDNVVYSCGSQHFWSYDCFTLLKIIENLDEILCLKVISITLYYIRILNRNLKNYLIIISFINKKPIIF